jgi:hypothetical protein
MGAGAGSRVLISAACLAILFGCDHRHDDDHHDEPQVVLFEDFSGSFPDPDWDILAGDPFTSSEEGHAPPALILEPLHDPILVRSAFVFGAERALNLSFEMATFMMQESTLFEFRIVSLDEGFVDAFFTALPFDDEIQLGILGSTETIILPPSTQFDLIEFTVDNGGHAIWWINGARVMSRSGFPTDLYEIEIETLGGDFTVLAVDNILLTRP